MREASEHDALHKVGTHWMFVSLLSCLIQILKVFISMTLQLELVNTHIVHFNILLMLSSVTQKAKITTCSHLGEQIYNQEIIMYFGFSRQSEFIQRSFSQYLLNPCMDMWQCKQKQKYKQLSPALEKFKWSEID